jgi:hypothetical protein
MMLDRRIPDKDWVRQIREKGDNNCSTMNLNNGLSAQCMRQNNHATLQGATIFYNENYVRTTKTKATAIKPIRFYYVLSAGKPAPTIPSNQGFYQLLWDDDLDRSNCTLKGTAPQAKKASATPPPTKKAKASSTRPILSETTTSNRTLSPPPSEPFDIPCTDDAAVV